MWGHTAFLLALLCAAVMGLAIQRGATCTVAAVDELLTDRRPTRLLAMLEASLWVSGGLLLARAAGHATPGSTGYSLTAWTIIGAALLGLGAAVNQACAFGTLARLGSGDWAFAATPLGFYLGVVSVDAVFEPPAPQLLPGASPVLSAPDWVLWVLCAAALARLAWALRQRRWTGAAAWSPHAATAVIGITFVALLLLVGAWAYTDVLADLAHRMMTGTAGDTGPRLLLCTALLAGAVAGGAWTGQLRWQVPSWPALLRCLAGGVLMGWGSLLIPGSNDGLVLLGMPLLWPYAWAAFVTMCGVVAVALVSARTWAAR
jgi:hypothetical protein